MASPASWPGTLVFYALAALVIGCAAVVAFSRNMLHSALALLGTLAGVAGLYLHLGADFLGITQLLIYVGGHPGAGAVRRAADHADRGRQGQQHLAGPGAGAAGGCRAPGWDWWRW